MKLRNKKTGEIVERNSIVTLECKIMSCGSSLVEAEEFSSIEQLNEEWEDYKPVEPLIKDEKIRKAVRAWAEANDVDEVLFEYWWDSDVSAEMEVEDAHERNINVKFNVQKVICDENRIYTIAELCGEEEE